MSLIPVVQKGTCIVIVTFNSLETIQNCLQAALGNLGEFDQLWVVDNASTDGTAKWLKENESADPRLHIVLNETNVGFSVACNQAIRASNSEFVCLLNPDTVASSTFLARLVEEMKHLAVAAVGPVTDHAATIQNISAHLNLPPGDYSVDQVQDILTETYPRNTTRTPLLTGFCCLWRRSVLEELGLLDENLFCGADDLDLCWRAKLRGYELLVARNVFVHHVGQVSFTKAGSEKANTYTQEANDTLARKLLAYYGAGNVPSQNDLWGISWYHTNVPLWAEQIEPNTLTLTANYPSGCFDAEWNDGGVAWHADEAVPSKVSEAGPFTEIILDRCFEIAEYPGEFLKSVLQCLAPFGRLKWKYHHELSHQAWLGSPFKNFATPFLFRALATQELVPGFVMCPNYGSQLFLSEYGSQLHHNQGKTIEQLQSIPRSIESEEQVFVKVPGKSWTAPLISGGPKASVVLPVFKRRALSGRQIDALFNQDRSDLEVFILGDACPDHAARLSDPLFKLKIAAAQAYGFKVITRNFAKNHGTCSQAINEALRGSTGTYFMFAGDDDWISPNHTSNYIKAIKGSNHDVVMFDSNLVGTYYTSTRFARAESSHVGHSELIVKTELAKRMPGHTDSSFHDWEFLVNLSQTGAVLGKATQSEATYWVNLARTEQHYGRAV